MIRSFTVGEHVRVTRLVDSASPAHLGSVGEVVAPAIRPLLILGTPSVYVSCEVEENRFRIVAFHPNELEPACEECGRGESQPHTAECPIALAQDAE